MSREPVLLPHGLAGLRWVASANRAGPRPLPAGPSSAAAAPASGPPAVDLGAVQREATERGRDLERRESGDVLRAAATALGRAEAAADAARVLERKEVQEFAVALALTVAEEVVGIAIRTDAIDVRGLVRRILAEVLPDQEVSDVTLEAHPDDLQLLPADFAPPGVRLRMIAEPELDRCSFRLRGPGFEYWSRASDRLEGIRKKLFLELGGGGGS